MIALPNYLLSDKIATPNKVPALKGVSPISSARNIMVKVKDTASFIEAARAVHGDKYDYSSTVWNGWRNPATIICKKCGPFTLAQAGTHYCKKACGCRFCEIDAMLERRGSAKKCNQCGARLKYNTKCDCPKPPKKYKTCDCVVCGMQFRKVSGKSFCSKECRDTSLESKVVETQCCNCGKSITKRHYGNQEKFCCSLKCQNEWALITNKGRPEPDWFNRSVKAKKQWKKEARKQRLKDSHYWSWMVSIRDQLANVKPLPKQDPWLVAINTRFVSAIGRDVVKKQSINVSGSVEKALVKVDCKRKYFDKPVWDKKLGNKLSSLSSRRRRKKNAKGIKNRCGNEEARGVAVQMCFDWVEDNSSML